MREDAKRAAGEPPIAGRPASARLFVALAVPDAIAAELSAWAAAALAGQRLRPLAADALHVTLCFLGARPLAQRDTIERALAAAAGGRVAPLCAAGELVWLPPSRPRVLALSLFDADGALGALQRAVATALAEAGVHRPERRPFSGHVTLARVRRDMRIDRRAAVPQAPAISPWYGELLCLFSSLPAPGGSRYERLVTLRLKRSQSAR